MKKKNKVSNESLKSLVILLLYRTYFNLTKEKFEEKVMNLKMGDELLPEWERKAVIKHFKKQIYPVKNEIALWLLQNLKKEYDEIKGINFYDRYNELQKLFTTNKKV